MMLILMPYMPIKIDEMVLQQLPKATPLIEVEVQAIWDEWSVYLIADSCVLGQDGNTTLALDVIAVHDSFLCVLVGSEDFALLEHRVHLHEP